MPNAPDTSAPSLGDVLVHQGLITSAQHQKLVAKQNETGLPIGRLAVEERMIGEKTLMSVLQMTYGVEQLNLEETTPDPAAAMLIPRVIMEKYNIYPISRDPKSGALKIVMQDASDTVILDAIRHQVKMEVRVYAAPASEIQKLLNPAKSGASAKRVAKKRGPVYRILSSASMPLFAVLPFPVFILMMIYNEDFNHYVLSNMPSSWDLGIYVGLGWSLWAIILFEINGLIFGRGEEDEE